MGATKIEWAQEVWNPATGCTPISAGCQNCYAKQMATRLRGRCGYPADEPFRPTFHVERLQEPLRWKKPRRIFVCSMGDLFHDAIPFDEIDRVFAVMALCQQHTFMVLTKRPQRMADYFTAPTELQSVDPATLLESGPDAYSRRQMVAMRLRGCNVPWRTKAEYEKKSKRACELEFREASWPLPNVWLGTSVENQAAADERIPWLLKCPAAVRFLSCEPLLGPVVLDGIWFPPTTKPPIYSKRQSGFHDHPNSGIHWVIAGGESGPKARPSHPDWFRSLRDQCQAAGVPFFFKQWGEWREYDSRIDPLASPLSGKLPHGIMRINRNGSDISHTHLAWTNGDAYVIRVGKKNAGRLLDGREWNELPE